jgi:sulfatase modifying factor 1
MKKQAITLLLILSGFANTFAQSYPEMILVEGGTFTMGDTEGDGKKDEQPVHEVTLKTFSMAKTETTVAQWKVYIRENGLKMPNIISVWFQKKGYYMDLDKVGAIISVKTGKEETDHTLYDSIIPVIWNDQDPIAGITWEEAVAYCDWLSDKMNKRYRLPTEAEWEYAARGGKNSKGFKYSGGQVMATVGWAGTGNEREYHRHGVSLKRPNELGLYDMSGNVSEMCNDWYDDNYYSKSPTASPKGPTKPDQLFISHVVRGGCYNYRETACTISCRSSGDYQFEDRIGFRVVLSQ